MKKLFLYVFLVLMFCNVSFAKNCTEKDEEYAKEDSELYGDKRTYTAEEAYSVGQKIVDIFKAKDLEKLVSMFDGELKKGPPLSYFKNKTFDEAFQQGFQDFIINSKIWCGLVDSNLGFTVGDTLIWFDKTKDNRWVIRRIHYGRGSSL